MKSRINRDEREISISELWWYIISKWKWLVIGMVVGALLLGVFGTYKASANNAGALKGITMEDLTEEEQEEVKALVEEYELYQAKSEENENSYLMKLNSNSVYRCMVTYYVDTDYSYNYMDVKDDYADELVSLYKTYVVSDDVRDKIVSLNINGLVYTDLNYMISTSNEGNIIKIAVCASKEDCETISNVVCEALEQYYNEATEFIGEHSLKQLSTDIVEMYNENVKNGQTVKNAYVKGLSDNIDAAKSSLSPAQKQVYEAEISGQSNSGNGDFKITLNKKYIVVGAVAGIAVSVVGAIVIFILGKRVKTVSEIEQVCGIDVIGKIIKDSSAGKYALRKINKIKNNKTENEQIQYVADTILNKCRQDEIKELAFATAAGFSTEELEGIVKVLTEDGIKVKCIDNINCDSAALNLVVDYKNVVFIEKLNVTTKDDIFAEIEVCEQLSVNVVGMVVLI